MLIRTFALSTICVPILVTVRLAETSQLVNLLLIKTIGVTAYVSGVLGFRSLRLAYAVLVALAVCDGNVKGSHILVDKAVFQMVRRIANKSAKFIEGRCRHGRRGEGDVDEEHCERESC